MPIRTRRRKNEGLRKYVAELYRRPARRFLRGGEPWEDLADVMFGPPTSRPTPEQIAKLKAVWAELREDILKAQEIYSPDKKPWGTRFDGKN